ncbi:MAG TPA: hypothetical protein DDY98_00765, partial [Ruminococcaceae bacterium]|nr:hypothetical protein [Oscillospiraceae bacterium]
MIQVTLKDDVVKEYESGITVAEIAKSLGMGLYKAACLAKVDGKVCDLRTVLTESAKVEILTFDDEDGKKAFRHTASHILAQAVKRLYPEAKLAIGPAIDNGFYYDFDVDFSFTPEILEKIEAEMKKIVKEGIPLERHEMSPEDAIKYMEEKGEIYKVELIREHADKGENISFFKQGDFDELCAGPHLPDTSRVKAFKLTSATGAYWRGDSKQKMLQRIYGTAFTKQADLEAYLEQVEEAKKRDHNKLGRELELFTTAEIIGQGLPILLPKGARIIQLLQRFVEDEEQRRGWLLTKTPYMAFSGLLAYVALADGEVSDDEVATVRNMFERMGLTETERAMCIGNCMMVKKGYKDAREGAKALSRALNPSARTFLYALLWRVANADRCVSEGERKVLDEIGETLKLDSAVLSRIRAGDFPKPD